MTNADSISEKLCQAIELIAEKKVSTANYDRTIQATIVSCQDESIGKYKVRYQDGYWYAYGSNIENTYSKGELVYILVPGGDMNNDKTILGSTTRMATNLTTVVNETDRFIPIGNNALPESSYELCSYFNEPVPLHPIYIRGAEGDIGSYLTPTIDAQIKEYISRGTVVDIGFTAQTNLPPQQKSAGNYGLLMNLIFKDPATEELIKREYVLDVDNMQGNPYNLITETFQHKYYDIDGANFEYIDSIYLFVQDFPEHYDTKPDDKPYDIFIKNLYFNSAELMSEQDYNSNSLVLLTPKGYIFNDTDLGTDARRLQAQVRVKGKIVSENNPDLSFYWFRENSGINAANPKFSTYGKQGWECLNDHVPNKTPYEYVKGKSYYDVLKEVCYTKETKFKCVAVYGETVLSKEITIINNDADYTITLTTDSGKTAFPENSSESPVIICNVDPAAAPSGSHYVYDWCYYDSSLVYHTILKDAATDGNITNLNTLKDFIDTNLTATDTFSYTILKYKFEEAEIELLDGKTIDTVFAENSIAKNENITYGEFTEIPSTPSVSTAAITLGMAIYNRLYQDERSSGNEVHNVHIPNIVNYRIYKCSVFVSSTPDDSSKIYIGTAALRIINGIDELDIDITTNKLIIQNGTQVFKYNTAGVSPCAKSNKNPYQIPNLNLLIYDHEGNDITTEALRTSVIVWRVPVKHTLLDFSSTGYTLIPDPNNEDYAYIKNEPSLVYGISNKYYMNYSNNTIYVAVDYDDETLMGATNLTFLKEGISGTNGTEYSINIIFANTNDRIPYPTIYYYDNNNISCNWKNSLPRADENWFKVQLWHNGGEQPIFEGATTGNATDTDDPTSTENTVTVRWRVLFRSYPDATINHFINCSSLDDGDFSSVPYFNLDTTKITQYWNLVDGGNVQSLKQNAPANLIQVKVTYKGLDYYDVLPILFSRVASGDTSYKINLQEGTGFTEVLFDTNGTTREFDNTNPFSIQVGGGQVSDFSYQFTPVGSVRYFTSSTQTAAYTDIDYLIPTGRLDELPENQKRYEPCNRYDGQATNIGLICQIKRGSTIFGTLLIPIYFYINRYFNSALNGWDGNSIDLGQTNGGMILAPQVGAGYKEEDNSFTGVVIGTAQDPQARIDSESSAFTDRRRIEAGLFGYNKGTRSIFLDAKTGKAEFGAGDGRIILDPSMDRALLFNDGYREVNNGIAQDALGKIDYSYTGQGQGLKIDLTKPEIKYGNGKFAVDQNGNITSMSGHIGGWKITEHTLESDAQAVDENGRPLYDNDGNPVSAIYLDSLTHTIRGGTLISNFGQIGGWNISTHRLYSDDANEQETDENGNPLYRDADGNLLYRDKEDDHLYYKEKHLLYEGEEADLIVPTHSVQTYERVQKTDENGNLLYKDKQGVLLYKDKNDGHFYYTPQSPYTGEEEDLTPSMDFIVHTEQVQDTDKKGNLLYKDGEDNIIYKDKEDELLYYKNKFSLYGDDEATVEPIMIPNIYLDSQTETIYGGTIIGSVIKSKNYTEIKDENDKIIDTVGTMINLNDSTFRFADNGLYYEDDVLYVRSLAGGTVSRIKEVLTASGYSLNARDKDWKEEQKDRDRGYILINNPYLQKNPDRPQEALWYEPQHKLDGEGYPSQEQKDPNSKLYDGGAHYGSLVYGEDIPKSKETAHTTGHMYRITWDSPELRFYVDGILVSTLGTGSYVAPYSEIFGNMKIDARDGLLPLRVNPIRTFTDNVIVNIKNPTGIRPSDSMSALKVGVIKTIRENIIPRNDLMLWAPYVNSTLQTVTDVTIDSSTKKYSGAGTIIIDTINPPSSMQIIDNEYPRYYCSFDNGSTWKGYSALTNSWQDDYSMTSAELQALDSTVWNNCQPFKIKIVMDNVSILTQITAYDSSRNTDSKISITFDEGYVGKNWTVVGGIESYSGTVASTLAATVTLIAPITTYTFICDHRTITYTTGNYGATGVILFDASVITINFMAEQEGETWTVTDGDTQTYTGTVGGTLTATARVQQLNTTYTITCGEEERVVRIGNIVSNHSINFDNSTGTFLNGEEVYDFGTGTLTKSNMLTNAGRVIFTAQWDNQTYNSLTINNIAKPTQTVTSSTDQKLTWCTTYESNPTSDVVIDFPYGDGGSEGRFMFAADADTNSFSLYSDGKFNNNTFTITTTSYHSELWLVFWCSSQSTITQFTLNGETVSATDLGGRWNGYTNRMYKIKMSNVNANTVFTLITPSYCSGVLFVAGTVIASEYLPYSNRAKITNESTVDNFDANSTNWDNVVLSNTTTLNDNHDAVRVGYPINAYGLLDVGQNATVYIVAKCIDSRGDNQAALTRASARTGDNWYGIRATTSVWRYQSGTSLSTNDFVVAVLKYNNGTLTEYLNNLSPSTTSVGTMDNYVGIGIATSTNSASYGNSTTLEVKYIGAVSEAESDTIVQQNINNLMVSFMGGVVKITKPINGYTYTITPNFGQSYTISCTIYGVFSKTSHQYTVSNKTIKIELTGQNSSTQTIYGAIYVDNVKVYDISTGTTSGGNGSYPVDYTSGYFDIS